MAIAVTITNPKAVPKATINKAEQKRRGWVTKYGFIDTQRPVTFNEAMRIGAELEASMQEIESENND